MTKKLRRKLDHVFNYEGDVDPEIRTRAVFDGAAALSIDAGDVKEGQVNLFTDHWYSKQALDELIAELLFLKEEWENHPVYLEQEQAEDMEEIAEEEEWVDEAADFDPEVDQPNPFNQEIQREHQQRMEELIRQVQRQRHNIPR